MDEHEDRSGADTRRRAFLKKATVATGAAWVAPVVLSRAASAQQGSAPALTVDIGSEPGTFALACGPLVVIHPVPSTWVFIPPATARILDVDATPDELSETPPAGTAAPGEPVSITMGALMASAIVTYECL